ncbi:MAG: Gfo/Idh/MocA family protein, partial [Rhizobiaceae bacterium]
ESISVEVHRIGVAGAGLVGQRHIDLIRQSARADLAFVADPSPAAKDIAKCADMPCFSNLAEALEAAPADGVVVATPNNLHVENGLECVRAGLPVLIEKPIADEAEPSQHLINESAAAGVPILVGHHRRYNPIVEEVKARIDAGTIGDIVALQAACWLYKPDEYFEADWRTRKGAGPVFINLIHDVDLFRHLVGEVVSVLAMESNRTRGYEVEDTAAIILDFENGALGTVTVSDTIVAPWSWELTAAENPAYPATDQTCYQIGGTFGALEVPTGTAWSQEGKRSWWRPIEARTHDIESADPLVRQLDHFCDVIEGRAQPLVSGEEGLKSLRVIEAIKRSVQTRSVVAVK